MRSTKTKINAHISVQLFVGYLVGALFVFAILLPTLFLGTHIYEKFTSAETWFEYVHGKVVPVKTAFKKDEQLRFNSFVIYKKDVRMHWEDTLYCTEPDGIKKYQTQRWPEKGTELTKQGLVNLIRSEEEIVIADPNQFTFWAYTKQEVNDSATDCVMTGVAIAETPLGYEKYQFFITDPFLVNQ